MTAKISDIIRNFINFGEKIQQARIKEDVRQLQLPYCQIKRRLLRLIAVCWVQRATPKINVIFCKVVRARQN